jgi:hypothetical protein
MSFFRHFGSSSHRYEFSILVRSFLPSSSFLDFSPSDGLLVRFDKHGKTNQSRVSFYDIVENSVTWDEGVQFKATLYFNPKLVDPLHSASSSGYERKPFSLSVVNSAGSVDWSCEFDLSAFANAREAVYSSLSLPLTDRLSSIHSKKGRDESEEQWNKRRNSIEMTKKNPPKLKLIIQSKRISEENQNGEIDGLKVLREEEHEGSQAEREDSSSHSLSSSVTFPPPHPFVSSNFQSNQEFLSPADRELKKRTRTKKAENDQEFSSQRSERSRARAAEPDSILLSDKPARVQAQAPDHQILQDSVNPSNSVSDTSEITVDDILSGSLAEADTSSNSLPPHRRHLSLYGQNSHAKIKNPPFNTNHDPLSFTISGLRNSSKLSEFGLFPDTSTPTLQSFVSVESPNKAEEPNSPTSLSLSDETTEIIPIQDPAHSFISPCKPTSAHISYETEYRARHEQAIQNALVALFPSFSTDSSFSSASSDFRPNSWLFLNYQNCLSAALKSRQEAAEAEEIRLQQKLAEMEKTKFSQLPEKERQKELKRLKAFTKEKEKEKKKEAEKTRKMALEAEKMRKKAEKEQKNSKSSILNSKASDSAPLIALAPIENSSSFTLSYEQRREQFRSSVEVYYWNSLPVSACSIFRCLVRFHAFQLIQSRDTENQSRGESDREKKKKLEKISSPTVLTMNWAPRSWILTLVLNFYHNQIKSNIDNYPLLCHSLNSLIFLHHCAFAFLESTPSAIQLWPRKNEETEKKRGKNFQKLLREAQIPIPIALEKALKSVLEENKNERKRKEVNDQLKDEENENSFVFQFGASEKVPNTKASKAISSSSPKNGAIRFVKANSLTTSNSPPLIWFLSRVRFLFSSSLKHFFDRFLYELSVRISMRDLIADKFLKDLGSETLEFLIEFLTDLMEFLRVSSVLPIVQSRIIAVFLHFISRFLTIYLYQELFRHSSSSANRSFDSSQSFSFRSVETFLLLGMRLMMIHQELYEWCVRNNGGKDLPTERNQLHEQLKAETMERNGEKIKTNKKNKNNKENQTNDKKKNIQKGQEFLSLCRVALKPIHHLALFCLSDKKLLTAQSLVELCYSLNSSQLIVLVAVYNQVAEAQLIRLERSEKELMEAEEEEGEKSAVGDELRALEPVIQVERRSIDKISSSVLDELAKDRNPKVVGNENGQLTILDQLLLTSESVRSEVFDPLWAPLDFSLDLALHKFNLATVPISINIQNNLKKDSLIWAFLLEDENLII